MNQDKVKQYDEFFIKNYKLLLGFSKSIDVKNDYESLTHDVFIRCRDRIEKNGYIGDDFLNYTRCSIMNYYKSQYRQNKKKQIVDIEDTAYYRKIEETLLENEEFDIQEKEIEAKNIFLNTSIYEYLDKYATPKENFIFKTYYLLRHRHLNYKSLAEITGYSITTVSNTIKKLKKELRHNILCYINTGSNMEELLKEAQELLQFHPSTHWEQYRNIYQKITGASWNGCKCKKDKIRMWLIDWYNQNKTK